jgi:predicted ATPase with chaperone activity
MEVLPRDEVAGYAAIGELSLDGRVNPVAGVLPAALGASALSLGLICPAEQGGEIEVLAAPDLLSLLNHFRGTQVLTPPELPGLAEPASSPDLADVKGMETAKRALEICAAGGHSLMLVGPPRRRQIHAGRAPARTAAGNSACPRAASRACCGYRAPSPISRQPSRWNARMWRRR